MVEDRRGYAARLDELLRRVEVYDGRQHVLLSYSLGILRGIVRGIVSGSEPKLFELLESLRDDKSAPEIADLLGRSGYAVVGRRAPLLSERAKLKRDRNLNEVKNYRIPELVGFQLSLENNHNHRKNSGLFSYSVGTFEGVLDGVVPRSEPRLYEALECSVGSGVKIVKLNTQAYFLGESGLALPDSSLETPWLSRKVCHRKEARELSGLLGEIDLCGRNPIQFDYALGVLDGIQSGRIKHSDPKLFGLVEEIQEVDPAGAKRYARALGRSGLALPAHELSARTRGAER